MATPVDEARYGGTSDDQQVDVTGLDREDGDVAALPDERAQSDAAVNQDPEDFAGLSFPEELLPRLRSEAATELRQTCLGLLAEARGEP